MLLRLDYPRDAARLARSARSAYLAGMQQPARIAGLSASDRDRWTASVEAYQQVRARIARVLAEGDLASQDRVIALRQEERRLARSAHDILDRGLSTRHPDLGPRDPLPGELILTWSPVEDGWVGFAMRTGGVRSVPLRAPPQDPRDLASWLFSPFDDLIDEAVRVTLLPTDTLRALDLHALAWRHRAPQESAPDLGWALDLPGREGPRLSSVPHAVLVVSDPQGDLAEARAEGARVAELLLGAHADVQVLAGESATRAAVLEAIGKADLFHFAGHGQYAMLQGHTGSRAIASSAVLDARLLLASGTDLSVADILALPRVPRVVMLSGCDTARSAGTTMENLGLAQAFITAGSEVVVAASRPVPDVLARTFAETFYAHWTASSNPLTAFNQTVRDLWKGEMTDPILAFRILLP